MGKAGWIAICLIVLLTSFSSAQPLSKFGVKAGINAAMFHGGAGEKSPRFGYHAGVYYRRHIGDLLTLRPEIFYSLEGTVFGSTSQGQYTYAGVQSTTTVHKLSVPVLIEIGRKLTFDLGGQLGLLLAANSIVKGSQPWVSDDRRDLSDDMTWGDFSVVGGVGFHPGRHFEVTIRCNYGLSRIFEPSAFPQVSARHSDFRSGVLQATVGYSF